jgi:Protein of unknown function (DUF3592)
LRLLPEMLKPNRLPPKPALPMKPLGGGCLMLFGLPFILVGLGVAAFIYFPALATWWSARNWEEVPCWIEKAELRSSSDSWGAAGSYRYEYQGGVYHSDQVSFVEGSDNIGDFHKKAHAQMQAFEGSGRPFRCFVNPAKPGQAVLFRELRAGLLLLLSVFPTLFPLAGIATTLGAWLQMRQLKRGKQLAAQCPGEPWRWRAEWVGDAVAASADGLGYVLGVAGWILLIQVPLLLALVISGELFKSWFSAVTVVLSLLAGVPLWFAWQRVRTRLALGSPRLALHQRRLVPGQALEGKLLLERRLEPLASINVRVLCQHQVTRNTSDGTTTTTETLWEHALTLSAAQAGPQINGAALPLYIEIPGGLPCAVLEEAVAAGDPSSEYLWSMTVCHAQGGRPATLPLPFFATEAEALAGQAVASAEAAGLPDTGQLERELEECGVLVEFDAAGAPVIIDGTPRLYRRSAIFLFAFGMIWTAIFVVLLRRDAPLLFQVVWGVSAPIILGSGVWVLLHRRRVELRADELYVLESLGVFHSWSASYGRGQILGFSYDNDVQSGNLFYYRVRAKTTFGKTKTLISGITSSATAEAMVRRLEEWLR